MSGEPHYRFRRHLSEDPWHDYDIDTQKAVCGAEMPDMVSFSVVEVDPQPRCDDCKEKA